MDSKRQSLIDRLHAFAASRQRCALTVSENGTLRHVVGTVSSVSNESIVLYEHDESRVDLYPLDTILDVDGEPDTRSRHPRHTSRTSSHGHASVQDMIVRL